ncbi:ATP adenylyltransferase [Sodiomyces alkalinus F11]|uniref:ATP adenylyltransferase n=1 Tax=Sodiomyces alkalinus (strain CBS 110278 / VKM F-3762 / F11) TaxID=1314773 RepID=A0A3N2PNV3_SODAK|nr:ATP adenylyltransferase [Sodiomyces alkalinus F11]ROT36195.1 ATP adenylyltransferase [Sodiomyces alkalinus F11]
MIDALQLQLRFSPALANKPSAPRTNPSPESPHKPFNPFENPENGPLFITDLPPSHNLVLNKFAVVPEHFILATKKFKPQTHLLEPDDLEAAYACINAYHEKGAEGQLYVFFNSGPHSGASQPHRHLQLLPVARMKDGLEDPTAWDVLANRLVGGRTVETPFRTFAGAISAGMTGEELHAIYLTLYRQAVEAMRDHSLPGTEINESVTAKVDGEPAQISYNMAMTRNALVICPRRAEGATIVSSNGDLVGTLSLNGTVLAGTALVKSQAEWDTIRNDGNGRVLLDVLGKIGLPLDA